MQKHKIDATFALEQDQIDWLTDMAKSWNLPDASKALRVVLDHAIHDGDEDDIFGAMRCRRCG